MNELTPEQQNELQDLHKERMEPVKLEVARENERLEQQRLEREQQKQAEKEAKDE